MLGVAYLMIDTYSYFAIPMKLLIRLLLIRLFLSIKGTLMQI